MLYLLYNYFRELYVKASIFKLFQSAVYFFFFFCLCYFYITAVAEPCTKHKTALRLVLNAQLLLSESNKADPWKEGNCQHWRT